MSDADRDIQSTIAGLKAQDCPAGGWNGMPPELERATVADCLAHGVCGCIYGDAVKHIEQLRKKNHQLRYDADDDVEKSFEEAYRMIRERKAKGGRGWVPKEPTK